MVALGRRCPCHTLALHGSAGLVKQREVARESSENHPKLWKWRIEALGQIAIEKFTGLLPGSVVFRIGEVIGGLAWYLMPFRQRVVMRNLRIAFHGEYDLPTLRKMARQTFRRTGANLLSALRTTHLSADQIDAIVDMEGQELIDAALSRRPGIVLMPSHMGNWEILSRINMKFPKINKIGALYRPLNNPILDARVLAQRELDGTRLFSKRDSFHLITGFLRDRGILGILADQRVGKQGELVRFFGRLTRASPLPSLVARRSKSEVLSMSLSTVSPGRWKICYHLVNPPFKTSDCMAAIEQALKASPTDVFWFQERWKLYIRKNFTVRDWLGPDTLGEGKPHRALLWLAGAPVDWQLPESWTHPDVIYEIVLAPDQQKPDWLTGAEKIHTAPSTSDRDTLRKAIAQIDLAAALPIDYILACDAPKALAKAAAKETIPLISLTPVP
jgi:Kdo2-lipid IVA lauroyltransferase/acyltransferase